MVNNNQDAENYKEKEFVNLKRMKGLFKRETMLSILYG
jgi:hypothetical protein